MTTLPTDMPDAGAQPVIVHHYPTTTTPRILSLDVLRGIAVLFALFISVWYFGGFSQNIQNGLLISSKGFDYRLFGAIELLFDGKMRALIALVFGAGMLLALSKQNQQGQPATHELFIRRQMWLIAFGIVNGLFFLWTRDLLFHLGMMGILLFPFIRLSAKSLLIAALLVTLIYSGKNYWSYADDRKAYNKYLAVTVAEKKIEADSVAKAKAIAAAGLKDSTAKKDTLTKKQAREKGAWEGILAGMKYDPKKDDGNNKEMRKTSYSDLYDHLMPQLQFREAAWTYQFGIWDLAGAIFLGMALFRLCFFTGGFSQTKYLVLAIVGIAAGLLLGWYQLNNEQHSLQDYTKYITAHYLPPNFFFPFERLLAALGYASAVIFLINSGVAKLIWRGFASVGRMALSNYLLQSIICTLFFTGFGGGYFGRLTQGQLYLFVLELFVVHLVFSTLWLRVYKTGPAEWLLRSLIYWKKMPFKKASRQSVQQPISVSDTSTL